MKKFLLIAVAMVGLLPMAASARVRVGIFAGGPMFVPYAYGWHGWYEPYFGMYPYGPYFGVPNAGEVKLDTKVKDAEVFINGNFAGTAGELKTMTMRPGNYNIEIRSPGRAVFQENIQVLAGKTMKLHPDSTEQNPPRSKS
jgi:hypothetical protein